VGLSDIAANYTTIEKLAGVGTSVIASLVLFGVVIYCVWKIAPLLTMQNTLINNNTEVTKTLCNAVNTQTEKLQGFETRFAAHEIKTDHMQQDINRIDQRLDDVATTVSVIQEQIK
jgi:hypothetical protein